MASTPRFKVYDADNVYQAACKHPEEAAALVALLGPGSSIRDGHTKADIVWLEGEEASPAGDSYDLAAGTVWQRVESRMATP